MNIPDGRFATVFLVARISWLPHGVQFTHLKELVILALDPVVAPNLLVILQLGDFDVFLGQ